MLRRSSDDRWHCSGTARDPHGEIGERENTAQHCTTRWVRPAGSVLVRLTVRAGRRAESVSHRKSATHHPVYCTAYIITSSHCTGTHPDPGTLPSLLAASSTGMPRVAPTSGIPGLNITTWCTAIADSIGHRHAPRSRSVTTSWHLPKRVPHT